MKRKESPVTEAMRVIKEDATERERACANEINEVLKKNNCSLHIEPMVKINGYDIKIKITANK